jgi:hypothetical protein
MREMILALWIAFEGAPGSAQSPLAEISVGSPRLYHVGDPGLGIKRGVYTRRTRAPHYLWFALSFRDVEGRLRSCALMIEPK